MRKESAQLINEIEEVTLHFVLYQSVSAANTKKKNVTFDYPD